MAESTFSPLHTFVSVLRKLLTVEFASVKLKQYSTVRKQIKSLLQAEVVSTLLSLSLYEEISTLLKHLPPPADRPRTFQVALWPQFHTFRLKNVPRIWKTVEGVIPDLDLVLYRRQRSITLWPFSIIATHPRTLLLYRISYPGGKICLWRSIMLLAMLLGN